MSFIFSAYNTSSTTTYESTSSGHMCDMDQCVERPPYLSIISVGGSMDVSSGHQLVLHDFIVITYLTCYFFTVFADYVLYAFNVVCRTPIRHVSSSNGWTRTHAHVAVQQHHLSMIGLLDIRLRP